VNKVATSHPTITKDVNGQFEIQGHTDLALNGSVSTSIKVDPAVINLKVDTATDWPTIFVGAGSVLTALAVAYITRVNQKAQSRATIAGIRDSWIRDLRQACTDFGTVAAEFVVLTAQKDAVTEEKVATLITRLHTAQTLVELMIDTGNPDKQEKLRERELIESMQAILQFFQDKGSNGEGILSRFTTAARLVLEDAWDDVKQDVYGK